MGNIILLTKTEKRIVGSYTNKKNLKSEYWNGIWPIKICPINNEKRKKKQMTERLELLNQERISTLGEKEGYKYFGILETDIIKQAEMKEKKNRK